MACNPNISLRKSRLDLANSLHLLLMAPHLINRKPEPRGDFSSSDTIAWGIIPFGMKLLVNTKSGWIADHFLEFNQNRRRENNLYDPMGDRSSQAVT